MITIIISAFKKSEPLMNRYRHKMLKRYIEAEGYIVTEGTGSINGETEHVLIIRMHNGHLLNTEVDMFETLATLFQQDYYLVIKNDVALQYHQNGDINELGVWWDLDDLSCPPSCKNAILNESTFTRDDESGTYYGIQTPEMAKRDAFTYAERACELAGGCRCDTSRVRSFIYGTPEWLERQAAAARSYSVY